MKLNRLQDCCEFAFAVFDGAEGWLAEAIAIVLVVLVFNFLMKWLLKKLHYRFKHQHRYWHDGFVRALYLPLSYYIWFFAIIHALDMVNHRTFETHFFDQRNLWLNIGAVICTSWFFVRWQKNVVEVLHVKSQNKEIALDYGKIDVVNKLITLFIIFMTILLLMEVTNSSMGTLIAFGGVGGLALAFASQEIISNFFGGLMIYLTHPFGVGDTITVPEKNIEGQVEDIGWYMTRIRNVEKRPIYIPNSIFSRTVVITPSRMSHRFFKEIIGLRYQDIPKLTGIFTDIQNMLQQHPDIDRNQKTIIAFNSFGSSAIDILIQGYTKTISTEGFAAVRQDILLKILDIITKHGAEMPFPITHIEILKSSQPE